jgi:hypothetical protein
MNAQPIRETSPDHNIPLEHNPLLEGLTLASNENELFPLIARDPFRQSFWKQNNQDIDLFRSYMQQVVIPTKTFLRGGLAIHRTLKTSLYQQNPNLSENQKKYFMTGSSLVSTAFVRGIHEGLVIEGITGLGKSHLIQSSLSTIPRCIERENISGVERVVQINWIYLDLTSVASVEALAHRIVETVDSILNCNGKLFELTFKGVRSAQAKMEASIRLLKTHFCGIVVIDEIQYENFAISTAAAMRAWILRIANVGIGLIFSGNPLGFQLKLPNKPKDQEQHSTQILRRLFSSDNIRLDPAPSVDDPNWITFTKGINRCRMVGEAHPYDRKLELLKFSHTGGFNDFYVELHCSIEKLLAQNPRNIVDEDLINLAARKSSKLTKMKPLISAFTQKDSMALRLCTDVDYDYYQNLWTPSTDTGSANKQSGPVGIVNVPLTDIDPVKALADEKASAARKTARMKSKAEEKLSPAAAAVRDHHLDGLHSMISGTAKGSDNQ